MSSSCDSDETVEVTVPNEPEPAKTPQQNFAANVSSIRKSRGIVSKWLAMKAGMNPVSYSSFERGSRSLRLDEAVAIAEALWLPVDELVKPLTDHDLARLDFRVRYER